jgi:hypothetical protein
MGDALRLASIVTAHGPKSGYTVVEADTFPGLTNLLSLMVLVSVLEISGCRR